MGKQQLRAELIRESLSTSEDHMSVFVRGGYAGPPIWNRYVNSHAKDLRPFFQEIRQCMIREELIGAPASEYAIKCRFEFITGEQFAFDHKAWNEMQIAMGGEPEKPPKPYLKIAGVTGIVLFLAFIIYLLASR